MRTVQALRTPRGASIPILVHARSPSPVIAITANIHGDEPTGVGVVQELDRWLPEHLFAGTVVLYPSLNPAGLMAGARTLSDGEDLNRLFPGNTGGTAAERYAGTIWRDLERRRIDLLVDLHSDSARSIPYTIIDRALKRHRGAHLGPIIDRYAQNTGLTLLREYPEDQYQRYALDRSLAGAMVNRGAVPAVTIEAGPRHWLSAEAVGGALDAVRSLLHGLEVVSFAPRVHPTRVEGGPWRRSPAPRTRKAGVFREALAPGSCFQSGDVLGTVVGLDGTVVDRIVAPDEGVVISWSEICWVQAATVVGTLGVKEE